MSTDPSVIIAECERIGEQQVRANLARNAYGQPKLGVVKHWLDAKDRARAEAATADDRAARAEEIALARRAAEAAEAAAASAREANAVAREANRLASDANTLADRANRHSIGANSIAWKAMIASAIGTAIALPALVLKRGG